ncbi:phosphatidate cytidylyltransferase [Piscinibacter sp. Jin2]|uniref:Phosphatidate cytidylyltransferase n=1 Tax=Aquariibacter lacus TaxID=2801332 RepID=A0A9X0XBI2_9BURK|nr:phosphatidate cytidylyltransferase [Piscinibacter lacus]MBL0719142.1 phosphatidate cytidylyltransferase [Piscinibacter lacus]
MGDLRTLSVSQQTGLLFLIVFGLLALSSLALFARSLRPDPSPAQRLSLASLQRDLRAVWIGSLLFWLSWLSGPLGATLLFGFFSFLALREFITLMHTGRSDHRALILAFFVVLPLQYLLVGTRRFDLFSVMIPVYAFFALPVASALAGDPQRFLERNAKIQWGIMVCVYGLSHTPALLLLNFPRHGGRGAFLVFFLVVVVGLGQLVQGWASRRLPGRPVVRQIDRRFSWRAWASGTLAAGLAGALMYWATPFKPLQAMSLALIAAGSGLLGELVMQALKRDAGVRHWGHRVAVVPAGAEGLGTVTGAVGLLDRIAALCFAAPVFFHAVRWYFSLGR